MYVDDCLIFGCNKEVVEEFLTLLKKVEPGQEHPYKDRGFDFTNDRDLQSFLRVQLEREGDVMKIIWLLLIIRIIEAVGFDKVTLNSKPTPSTHILYEDKNSEECKDGWNYRSLIGILNYLANTTRPDISMAIH